MTLSQNVKWGKRQSFKNGKVTFQYSRFYGYEKGENGQPIIVAEQTEVVRRIFYTYLAGHSVAQIKKELESECVTSSTGKPEWSAYGLQYMLKNEKYIGDAILQKSYVVDFISKKTQKNNGEVPQYYVTDNHQGIVSRDIFNRVQEETARRSNKRKVSQKQTKTEHSKYSSKYALSELLVCDDCGSRYRRVTWSRNGTKRIMWRCINRLEFGTKICKTSPTIEEYNLHDAIVQAFNMLDCDKDNMLEILTSSLHRAIKGSTETIDRAETERQIAKKQRKMLDLVQESVRSSESVDFLDAQFKLLSDEIKALQNELTVDESMQTSDSNTASQLGEILALINGESICIKEYDDSLVRRLIDEVRVVSEETILVVFKGGMEIRTALQ